MDFFFFFAEEHSFCHGVKQTVGSLLTLILVMIRFFFGFLVKNTNPSKTETQLSANGELDKETLQQNLLRLAQRKTAGGKSPKSRAEK
jgi:UPF0716 family protein affecting phage T7 exclusion